MNFPSDNEAKINFNNSNLTPGDERSADHVVHTGPCRLTRSTSDG